MNSSINYGTTKTFTREDENGNLSIVRNNNFNNMWFGTTVDLEDFQNIEEDMIHNPNL